MADQRVVYLLWLHDSVLDVFTERQSALDAAREFRERPEYRDLPWTRFDGSDRWYTSFKNWLPGQTSIARLEVEPRYVK